MVAPSIQGTSTANDDNYSDDGDRPQRKDEEDVAVSQHCVLSAALTASSLELSVQGQRMIVPPQREQPSSSAKAEEDDTDAEVEELIACDGVLEEPIAAHIAAEEEGDDDGHRADRRRGDRCSRPTEAWVLQKYGLPPRTPPLAIKEAVVSLLLDRLWRSIVVPRLACVSNAAARMLEQQQQPQPPPQHGQGDEGGAGMLPHEPRPPQHHPPLSPPRFAAGAGGAAAQALRSLGPGHGPSRARSAAPHH